MKIFVKLLLFIPILFTTPTGAADESWEQYKREMEIQRSSQQSRDELRRALDEQRRADDRLWQQEQMDDLQMQLDGQRDQLNRRR